SVQAAQLRDEIGIRQFRTGNRGLAELRRAGAGNDQQLWHRLPGAPQRTREFKRNARTHAVAEEYERRVDKRSDGFFERLYQRRHVFERSFVAPRFTSGQANRTDRYLSVKSFLPAAPGKCSAAGVWKNEEPALSSAQIFYKRKPGMAFFSGPLPQPDCQQPLPFRRQTRR